MKLFKGVTLLELLIVLFILSITLSIGLPNWSQQKGIRALQQEQHQLYLFLRLALARAQVSSSDWILSINQQNERWCISAQKKSDTICDCFSPNSCPTALSPRFYYPIHHDLIKLTTNFRYPQVFMYMNTATNKQQARCFALNYEQEKRIFSFSGFIFRVKTDGSVSACNQENGDE